MRTMRVLLVVCVVMAMALPSALAAGGGLSTRGRDSFGATWSLVLHKDHGIIEVHFEVNTNHPRHTWRVVMRHNGVVFFRALRVSNSAGDFEVERSVRDLAGLDTIKVKAVDSVTGVVIVASKSI